MIAVCDMKMRDNGGDGGVKTERKESRRSAKLYTTVHVSFGGQKASPLAFAFPRIFY